ncbi:MAG: ABC transporter permease, partial [Albidovulum sp.]|nr:ABC transporter permease [Albidovulum sp.]
MIWVYRLGFLVLLVVLWILAAQRFGRNVVPTPLATFEAAQRLVAEGRLMSALGASLTVYLSGYALAVACAIPVGVVMGGFRLLGKTLEIYV